ncbi:MAG: ABC transporter substrate-binding protein [Deltaproteobacteria bacterium]|nr:ABC transporter substrate-binding protein [Deltaproteobacteria bacterium]
MHCLHIPTSLKLTGISVTAVCLLALLSLLPLTVWSAGTGDAPLPPPEEVVRLGEKMYRDGLFPSGGEVQAVIRDDVQVNSASFSCVSCHLRSGIGSIEGQILSPPTNGLKLYKPYYQYNPVFPEPNKPPPKNMMDRPGAKPLYRPAYTDETLAAVIRFGVNPSKRELNPVMPRYLLDDRDMSILIAYLKTLSAEHSPGVSKKEIRFATVIAGDVPTERRSEMLAILDAVIKNHNTKAKKRNKNINLGGNRYVEASFNYPFFTLSRWELTGPPATWRAQLDEYYRKEPVFALLGGMAAGSWQPMHEFSEQNKIPCLLPVTDLPVISESDWYTLYLSRGAWQEGDSAARYLHRIAELPQDTSVLQIIEDSATSRAVAAGFAGAWQELMRLPPVTVKLGHREQLSPTALRQLLRKEKPDVILLWTSGQTGAILSELAVGPEVPKRVHVSSTLLNHRLVEIPDRARLFTFISYPYRIDEVKEPFHVNARAWLKKNAAPVTDQRISANLFTLTKVLLEPFQVVKRDFNPAGQGNGLVIMEEQFEMMMHVRRNYYRDYLLDVIDMMADTKSLAFERVSFGPGQRYISKGCYIIKLSPGDKPNLIRESDWVIH